MDIDKKLEAAKEAFKIVPDLYEDGAKPTVKESGKLLGRIPRLINAALAPLDIWILNKEYNIEETKKLLAKKLEDIDSGKIVSPEPYVAVPALQAISYSMNSYELRNMYANLLANSMNKDSKDNVHPSFVEIIKQLSPFDAKLLKLFGTTLEKQSDSYPIMKINIQVSEKDSTGFTYMKHILSPYFGTSINNYVKYPISIDNLMRLNLIDVNYNQYLINQELYDYILNSDLIKNVKSTLKLPSDYSYINFKKGTIAITNLGQSFVDICIF